MTQNDYEIIVTCIKSGVPAIADYLVKTLNAVIDNSNKYIETNQHVTKKES